MSLTDTIVSQLNKYVTKITIESAWLPTIEIEKPFETSQQPNALLQLLKPKITIEVQGANPIAMTPYGEPGPTQWPIIKTALIVIASVLLGMIVKSVLRRGRR